MVTSHLPALWMELLVYISWTTVFLLLRWKTYTKSMLSKRCHFEITSNQWISIRIFLSDLALQILEDNVTVVGNVSTKKCPWYAIRSPPRLNIPVDYSKAFVISVQETKVMDLVWITPDSYMQPDYEARLSDFFRGKFDMQKMAYTCLLPSLVFYDNTMNKTMCVSFFLFRSDNECNMCPCVVRLRAVNICHNWVISMDPAICFFLKYHHSWNGYKTVVGIAGITFTYLVLVSCPPRL